jgi:transaldolase
LTTAAARAVFLDRDGVLVEGGEVDGVPAPLSQGAAVELRPGVREACTRLRAAGLLLVCVTNQPDVARGTITMESVQAVNATLQGLLALDAILVCPHDDADHCDCRKPRPGMLLAAADSLGIDLQRSVMVGDRWRDVEAGQRAGCTTVFIDNGYHERRPDRPDVTARGLDEAVSEILRITMRPSTVDRDAADRVSAAALSVEIFADGADVASIVSLAVNPLIKGFTTNPTLMRAAGVTDYERFAREVVAAVPAMPLSFEVFADDFAGMERQARRIAQWGDNVYAKIPVTDTRGSPTRDVISALSQAGVRLNVTALMTVDQVRWVTEALADGPPSFISLFAGRVADTGRDPLPIMVDSLAVMAPHPHLRLIWASPREILNVVQADRIGCHIITVTHDLLRKLSILGTDLDEYSLDTVRMFHRDAAGAGLAL